MRDTLYRHCPVNFDVVKLIQGSLRLHGSVSMVPGPRLI